MALKNFNFNVLNTENYSRVGVIETSRGNINTPAFMPVGTQATIKGAFIDDIIFPPVYVESDYIVGDTNNDMVVNVLDVVIAINFALYVNEPSDSEFWASDINSDGMINVLDIVQLVNIILEN